MALTNWPLGITLQTTFPSILISVSHFDSNFMKFLAKVQLTIYILSLQVMAWYRIDMPFPDQIMIHFNGTYMRHWASIVWSWLKTRLFVSHLCKNTPDSKIHGANMWPTWVLSAPDGLHVDPMHLAIRDTMCSENQDCAQTNGTWCISHHVNWPA